MRNVALGVLAWLAVMYVPGYAAVEKPANPDDEPAVTYRYPVVTAPKLSEPPTIDGRVDKAEWTGAAMSLPLVEMHSGLMMREPAVYWVGYTDEALYMAFRFMRPTHAGEPRMSRPEGNVWGDDSLELFLRPRFGARSEYNFVLNPAGTRAEGYRDGNVDKNWTAEWQGDARLIDNGWEGELRIAFAELDRDPPEPGETWEIAVKHIQRTPMMEIGSSSFLPNWRAIEHFGYLRFGDDGAPAVRAIQGGPISDGEAGALIELVGGDATRDVRLEGALYRPSEPTQNYFELVEAAADPLGGVAEGDDITVPAPDVMEQVLARYETVAQWEEPLSVEAGRAVRVPMVASVDYGRYVFHYRATDAQSGRLLAGETLPFELRPPLAVDIEPYLLIAEALAIEADYRRVDGLDERARIVTELLEVGTQNVVERKERAVALDERRTVLDLPVSGRLGERFDLRARLVSGDGAVIIEHVTHDYELPEPPEWWGNDYGRVEALGVVPEPWTPIEADADGFAVWGRTVRLDERLLPTMIEHHQVPQTGEPTRTEAMLAGPVELELVIDGEAARFGEARTLEHEPWVLRRAATIDAGDARGTISLEVEFDGLMRYRIDLEADDGNTPRIDTLRLIYRVPREHATHFNHGWLGTHVTDQGPYQTGVLDGEGLTLGFTSKLWLGSDLLGLDWVAQWDRWWAPMDNPEAVAVDVADDEAVVRITMVDARQDNGARLIDEPMHFEWAMLPTPIKPIQAKYRSHNVRLVQGGLSHDPSASAAEDLDDPERFQRVLEAPHPRDSSVSWRQMKYQRFTELAEAGANVYNVWAWSRGEHESGLNLWNPDFAQPGLNPAYGQNLVRERLLREANEIAYDAGFRWMILYMLWATPPADWPGVWPFITEMRHHPVRPSFGGYAFEPTRVYQDWYLATLRDTIEATGIRGMYQDSSAHPRFSANVYTGSGWYDDAGNLRGRYPIFDNREFHKRIWMLFHVEMGDDGLIYSHNTHLHFPVVESFVDVHHAGEGSSLVHDHMIPKWYGYPIGNPTTWTRWNRPPYDVTRMMSWRMALLMDVDLKVTSSIVTESRFINQRNYDAQTYPARHIWDARARFPWDGSIWVNTWNADRFVQTGRDDVMAALHYNRGRAALVTVSSFLDETYAARIGVNWDALGLDPEHVSVTDVVLGEPVELEDGELPLEILENRWRMVLIETTQ